MNTRQKRIVAALAVILLAASAALIWFVTSTWRALPSPLPTVVPQPATPTRSQSPVRAGEAPASPMTTPDPCQWEAAGLMSRLGLAGTVDLDDDGVLRFDMVYPLPADRPVEEAAQSVWTAFDVAGVLLQDEQCPIARVEVEITTTGDRDACLYASVEAEDLAAFYDGSLSEDAFIRRVTFWIDEQSPQL